jgi:hypothetical protein
MVMMCWRGSRYGVLVLNCCGWRGCLLQDGVGVGGVCIVCRDQQRGVCMAIWSGIFHFFLQNLLHISPNSVNVLLYEVMLWYVRFGAYTVVPNMCYFNVI